jgi:hypothetical protein
MRTLAYAFLLLSIAAIPAAAQTKFAAKQTCAKSDPSYSIDVTDQAGHGLMLHKSLCTYETPFEIEGIKSKDAVDVAASEMRGMKMTDNGYNTSTMENGDKFTVRYSGRATATKDGTAIFGGKWTFDSGTGKLKGIKGEGTYKGSGSADGSGTVEIEGEYTLMRSAAAKPTAK